MIKIKEFTNDNLEATFFKNNKIFRNEQLRKQYFNDDPHLPPDLETIPHRERQIADLQYVFGAIAKGRRAFAKVYGPNGTGKTLTINWLSQIVQKGLIKKGKSDRLHISYINCAIERGSFRAIFRKLVNTFPAEIQKKVVGNMKGVRLPLPESGLPSITYFNIFRGCYHRYDRQLLVILDEFDKILRRSENSKDATDIIYNLVEIVKEGRNQNQISQPVNVIIIVNSMQRFEMMIEEHALTRFQGPEVHFGTYSKEEIIRILDTRQPAFQKNVLEDNVIHEIAEYVALGEGNARVAIDILELAATIAETKNSGNVNDEHVKEAIKVREKNLLIKPILELNFDHTLAYIAVFVMHYINQDKNRDLLSRSILYNAYKYIYQLIIASYENPIQNTKLKTPRQFKRYLDGQLENEHLIMSNRGRPVYYGIPPEYSPASIKRILLVNPIVTDYPVLSDVIKYQTPELREIFLDSQKTLANYLDP